jgi:cytochrome c biogenesis protein CcdA
MIDWYSVGFSALWILGLGLVVAALGFAYYLAGQQKQRFRQALEIPACRIVIDLGLVFFALGWTGSVSSTWERIVWAVLALLFLVQTWQATKMRNV